MGMVGAINAPTSGNTFEAFQAAANQIGGSETTEPDNGPVTGGVNGVATAAPTASGSNSATNAVASVSLSLLSAVTVLFLA
ncbi:hypothetical protein MPER_10859 [Moniliophthora perniciosa FA553]|nr:hypothetical protein MPER_10859 [Moniliophthora perniciosa FA553]